jgi:hypothetical protein
MTVEIDLIRPALRIARLIDDPPSSARSDSGSRDTRP